MHDADLPSGFATEQALDEFLARPTPETTSALQNLDGDIMLLGVGGKMGPSLAALAQAVSPPLVLNLTGAETVSIHRLALEFGRLLGKEPVFSGDEQPDALLSNAARARALPAAARSARQHDRLGRRLGTGRWANAGQADALRDAQRTVLMAKRLTSPKRTLT